MNRMESPAIATVALGCAATRNRLSATGAERSMPETRPIARPNRKRCRLKIFRKIQTKMYVSSGMYTTPLNPSPKE